MTEKKERFIESKKNISIELEKLHKEIITIKNEIQDRTNGFREIALKKETQNELKRLWSNQQDIFKRLNTYFGDPMHKKPSGLLSAYLGTSPFESIPFGNDNLTNIFHKIESHLENIAFYIKQKD